MLDWIITGIFLALIVYLFIRDVKESKKISDHEKELDKREPLHKDPWI